MGLRTFAFVATVGALLVGADVQAQEWKSLEASLEGRELTMRPTIEGRRKIYIDDGDLEAFALYRGDRLFPLRSSERVRITDADPHDDHIELDVESTRLGKGRIDFYGVAPGADRFEEWLDEVFEVRTPDAEFSRFVGNRQSHTLHLRGANHLPSRPDREEFHDVDEATAAGYERCGVCFVPTPDVSDYETEHSLATLSLQQVRATYYPYVDPDSQERIARIGRDVLDGWPTPLKGYQYRFQVVDADEINAFAVPTGYIFMTRGLLESLESDDEVAAILAHEIAHVENRHSYRLWRNQQKVSAIAGVLGALAGNTNNAVDDVVALMGTFTAGLFLSGHGRDREREADMFASYYLNDHDIGDAPLLNAFRKLKFARDAYDPFGRAAAGPFATHPNIEERLEKARGTETRQFEGQSFNGLNRDGDIVATLRFDVQRLFERELDVVATLSTTAELGEQDNVNTINIRVVGQRIELKERTAEKIFPDDEVSAVFGNDRADGLIEGQIESVDLKLRNVDRWERATTR